VGGYIVRRLLAGLPLLWLIWTLVCAVGHMVPGRSEDLYASPQIHRRDQERLNQVYGLHRPLLVQYTRQLLATLRGDLPLSTSRGRPVNELIAPAVGPTLLLAGAALFLQFTFGIVLGAAAAARRDRALDHAISGLALTLHSIPVFWLGLLLVLAFSLRLGWLPPSHLSSLGAPTAGFLSRLMDLGRHMVLPLTTLTLAGLAVVIRHARSSLLEVFAHENLRAARARGLPPWRLLWRHELSQASLPLITLLGLALPALLSGTLLVEVVFSWPGLGQLTYQAILARDYPVVQTATLLTAVMVVLGNLAADLAMTLADPRTRPPGTVP